MAKLCITGQLVLSCGPCRRRTAAGPEWSSSGPAPSRTGIHAVSPVSSLARFRRSQRRSGLGQRQRRQQKHRGRPRASQHRIGLELHRCPTWFLTLIVVCRISTRSVPDSPVRMRIACSTGIDEHLAVADLAGARRLADRLHRRARPWPSSIATSIFTFGRKLAAYSAPRSISVWPFCRPNPFTSLYGRALDAERGQGVPTSSSLKGLKIATIIFICACPQRAAPAPKV